MAPQVEVRGSTLIVDLGEAHRIASTAVNGGLREARYIVIQTVDKGFRIEDHSAYVRKVLAGQGLPESTVVMLTAVDVRDHIVEEGDDAWALATVGLSNPACLETESLYEAPTLGTINIVAVSGRPLTDQALLDMLRIVAEAKAAAVADLLPWCNSRPVGTTSDAITVAAPKGGPAALWSGMATVHGNEAARLVWRAVIRGDRRGIDSRLQGVLGIGVEDLLEDAKRMYSQAPVPGASWGSAELIARRELERVLADPNVWILLVSAREADLHAGAGTVPGLSRDEYSRDTAGLIADEVLASALALYLQGWKGLMAAYWVDRMKHNAGLKLASLPGMLDDIAAALVGSILSRVYDHLLGGGLDSGGNGGGQG